MVEVLFALARDCFQPMKVMTPVHEEGVHHLPNPLEVTLRLTAPTPEVVYSALSSANGKVTARMHSKKDRIRIKLRKPTQHFGTKQDSSVYSKAKMPRCQDGQEAAKAAISQYARAVGFQEEADELGHALETWSDTAAQYWTSVGRKSQIPLSGKFATFRAKPVLGGTFMPLGCVSLEGGGNAVLRSWKAFGHWTNTIRRASPRSIPPEHALYSARKIVTLIQDGDTLSKKVMEDLSSEELRSVVKESSSMVLSLLMREGVGAHCQALSERARRLSERALQKGHQFSRRATHKWLSQALKGGAGLSHRWCGKEDALPELPLVIRDSQGNFTADAVCGRILRP